MSNGGFATVNENLRLQQVYAALLKRPADHLPGHLRRRPPGRTAARRHRHRNRRPPGGRRDDRLLRGRAGLQPARPLSSPGPPKWPFVASLAVAAVLLIGYLGQMLRRRRQNQRE